MNKTAKPVSPRRLVLSRETVRLMNEPVSADDAATGCACPTRCTCTSNLC